jgi:hypothetical protein
MSRRVRDALERALVGSDTSTRRMVDAVPEILSQAERRRTLRGRTEVASVARLWIPRLALAALGLVAVAWVWPARPEPDEGAVLDAWIVTGRAEAGVSDPVIDAIVRRETEK